MDAKTVSLVGFDLVREHLARECVSTLGGELADQATHRIVA